MSLLTLSPCLLVALFLAACGTSSKGSRSIEPPIPIGPPIQLEEDPAALQAPIVISPGVSHVGADVAPMGGLEVLPKRYRAWYGTIPDGTGQVAEYLARDAGRDRNIRRFGEHPPAVRVAEGATPEMTRETLRAVQTINASLPDTWQLRFAAEPATEDPMRPRRGQIVVEFQPREEWAVDDPIEPTARAYGQRFHGPDGSEIVSGHVWIDNREPKNASDLPLQAVIVRELLHALGRNRLDGSNFSHTVMNDPLEAVPGHVLHPLDREALLAVYGWLEPGTPADRIYQEFGVWSEESVHLTGVILAGRYVDPCIVAECIPNDPPTIEEIQNAIEMTKEIVSNMNDVRFGVTARNGLIQPWMEGTPPLFDLAENQSFPRARVRWSGVLLGLTPANRSVSGHADLVVDTWSLDGQLEFSELESWTAEPGADGTGNPWGDGILEYTITVSGNTFMQTGGDEGVVTGVFLGRHHHGMGGVLKRNDLTAAFGGGRPQGYTGY